ncbi:MAG: class I SAM-dependent methyltransferase [Acetobacteraceae bacterium]
MDNESFNRAVDFQSWEDWAGWHQKHSGQFEEWKRQIVATIERNGFVEPLTQQHADPKAIKIITGNYRESLSYNGLNSRKRGLLLEFDRIRQTDTRFADQNVRIFAPEALSRTALIFRGLYPYFLGTEYIPDVQKRSQYYPIQHADLLGLDMSDGVFDLVITGDVLEHVPDLPLAIREIARVLRPDGVLISTFPFAFQSMQTVIHARIQAGQIVHLRKPEYHGDPLDPQGVLVFQIPGWDVLDLCRAAGFSDARMVLHVSARHGVVADYPPGVLVLSARKGTDPGAIQPKGSI